MSEVSPVPSNVQIAAFPPPAVAGGVAALAIENTEPNTCTAVVQSGSLYDTTANPLIISPINYGMLTVIVNTKATSIKAKSPNASDPGIIIPALSTVLVGFDPQGTGGGFLIQFGGGSSGGTSNGTYSVATLALRPAPASVPDGTWVFVQSQKSWYWTDLAANTWRRLVVQNDAWMVQTAWGIDTVNGNDENVGSVASPLRTLGELFARLPAIKLSTTVTIAAGSAFGANDWLGGSIRSLPGAQAGIPTLTFQGVRTLGGNLVVNTSTDEVGNAAPTVDTGAALTIGSLVQATSGASINATAVVVALIAGTNYRTTPWTTGGFTRVAPPAPADTIAIVTQPTVARVAFSNPTANTTYIDLDIATIFTLTVSNTQIFRTCRISGLINSAQNLNYAFQGSALNLTALQGQLSKSIVNGSGFIFTGAPTVLVEAGCSWYFTDSVIQAPASITLRNNAIMEATSLGIFASTGAALTIITGAFLRVRGTLYGSGNATGTIVRNNGHVQVDTGTPTLAATGVELTLEASAQAIPPLTPGAAVPANWPANALGTWANWNAAPFTRFVMSYASGASICG